MILERVFVRAIVLSIPFCLMVVSCKKKKEFNQENGQSAVDARNVQARNDEAIRDVNVAVMEQSLLRGKSASELGQTTAVTELCGVDVDTLSIFQGIIRLHYNGVPCNGVIKTGNIIVTVVNYPLKKWKNKGCVLRLDFVAYTVNFSNKQGQTITLDGTEYLENQSGNTWYEMRYLDATNLVQVHKSDGLKASFGGNNTGIFNINCSLTYNYSSAKVTSCKIEGLGSSEGVSNLESWGLDRNGVHFTSQVNSPLVWKSTCGSGALLEGEITVTGEGKDYEMKCNFAVDNEGNSVSVDSSCPHGWKVSWSYKKKTNTRVFAYN